MKNQFPVTESLDKKYNNVITKERGLLGFEDNISVVNLMEFRQASDMETLRKTGLLGNLVEIYWSKIREGDVLPLIDQSNPSLDLAPLIQYRNEPIAIVGMSCRYPESNNLEEFWSLLFQGQDGISNPPPFRWIREQCTRHSADKKKTNAGFLKVPVDEFDAKFFGISPKEVLFMDPQHRLLHELVWEGLEDACIDPHTLRGTSGSVFMGSWMNDYKEILMHSRNSEFYRAYMGNSIGSGAARLSFLLGLTGPSIATESGCSSAMVAVHLACRSLQNGETNLAIAGGVNLLIHPFDKDIMPMVISPDGICKTFSEDANGFARAEGCGVLVMKRMSDALKDGDNIWALIRGSAVAQEGVSTSMGTPTVHCESIAMRDALKDGGVLPEQVSYVEAHGTGTTVGDPMEVAAIAKAYHSTKRQNPLIIGSVKTNVGHTESCSGITGIMKVVLGMHHEIIPKHRNFTKLNPDINLDAVPAIIPMEPVEWKKTPGKPRIAGVSSFGITGTDAHAIIEEPPQNLESKALTLDKSIERPVHILKFSAKTEEALEKLMAKHKEWLETSEDSLADIAYSLNTGRTSFNHRLALVAKNKAQAAAFIEQQNYSMGEVSTDSVGKVCFLFTGQGSQYPGMAKKLYDYSPIFQMHFDYCEKIFNDCYNISLKKVLWSEKEGSQEEDVSRTIYSQTSIFCVEYALLKLWESWGVRPDCALGHSLGEFAAAVCAGIISVEDAIKLVAERSKLIDELPRGKMLVIQADYTEVQNKMKEFAGNDLHRLLDYAAVNSSSQTVVAGDSDVIMEFSRFLTENKVKSIVLAATHAFHSRHMDPMLQKYTDVAKTTRLCLKSQSCEYISGMKGDVVSSAEVDSEYWVHHTREKVDFLNASQKAVELGCDIFIEIGPQPILTALTMMNSRSALLCLPSMTRKADEWETILNSLGKLYVKGMEIDLSGLDQFYNRKKTRLPHYPFIGKTFWPELLQVTGNAIHPLVGALMPNASSLKIFQCGLNLQSHEYIKDHSIGQTVVFPGAGYLEMSLAAGLATVESSVDVLGKPSRPMKVENLFIKAPMALHESKICQVQTVVELSRTVENKYDSNDVTVKIYHRVESEFSEKWLEHATAIFSPLPSAEEQAINFDVDQFKSTLSHCTPDSGRILEAYDKLASIGLIFGPSFRSLEGMWKNETDGSLLVKVKTPPSSNGQPGQYIVHPVVLDAMIQAIMMLKVTSKLNAKLFVPIKIGHLLWLPNGSTVESSEDRYIHVFDTVEQSSSKHSSDINTITATALLVDSKGNVVAVMSGVEFIDTTVKAVESVLEQQTSAMPDLWEESWRPRLGPLQHRHDVTQCRKENFCTDELMENVMTNYNKLPPQLEETFKNLEQMVYYNMIRCLYECGWVPVLNENINEEKLRVNLGIEQEYSQLFSYILRVLEEKEMLKNMSSSIWIVIATPPPMSKIEELLGGSKLGVDLVKEFEPALLFAKIGENYSKILKGELSALPIMFPEDGTKSEWPSVGEFYTAYGNHFKYNSLYHLVATEDIIHCKSHYKGLKNVLRVLEVGAGTGSFTQVLINSFIENNVEFEYTYTDISAAFFPAAEKKFEKYLKMMTFKKLNIEEDPIKQGFPPNYFDYVLASDVIHATKDIKITLNNVRTLLRTGGKFLMNEMTKVNRFITFLFGLLDGFWCFEDKELRKNHCTLSTQKWTQVLEDCGLDVLQVFPSVNSHHACFWTYKAEDYKHLSMETKPKLSWVLFHQEDSPTSEHLLETIAGLENRDVITVTRGGTFQTNLGNDGWRFEIRADLEDDFYRLMNYIKTEKKCAIEGVLFCWSLDKNCVAQESLLQPYFYATKAVLRMKQISPPKLIALVDGVMPVEDNDLFGFNSSTIWGFTKALKNERVDINCRVIDIGGKEDAEGVEQVFLELWNTDKDTQVAFHGNTRYICKIQALKPAPPDLNVPKGTDRFKLVLPETKSIGDLQFGSLGALILSDQELEIQVKTSALNFRDVFSVLKPTDQFKNVNAVGFDFAGVVKRVGNKVTLWSVGDRVFGLNVDGEPLPSHLKLNEKDIFAVPHGMTFCDACTLPAVVATSFHSLVDVAQITARDIVLIHAASGGVGLSAIQICQSVGARIIATAGSKRKQNYLRSLGIKHIFHSRNTEYGDEILKVTNGRGVDIVLNSLTSEGFKEATLKACAIGARFIEMSKLNVWKSEEVKKLRPDVLYTIVDLSAMSLKESRRIMGEVTKLTETNVIRPLPYVRFDGVHIREALQYLQKAKHIGKVVCEMPEVRQENGSWEVQTSMFNENSTYLITGGLGGIGFVVCKWMVGKGAKHVLLASRSAASETMQQSISLLNMENGTNVQAVQLDVGDFQQCWELLQEKISELGLPPLRGIMHAAGVLSNGLIENQTWEKLSSTFETKVKGTLNLHELTKTTNLEHFVLFSSMAAMFGSPGQSNHSAGNNFEDSFAQYRNSIGLPATSVNWGQWGEVGIATEVDLPGVKMLSNLQGTTGLEYAMKSQRTQTAVINVESFLLFSKLLPHISSILDDSVWKSNINGVGSATGILMKSEEFWQNYDSLPDLEGKLELVKEWLRRILKNILRLDDSDFVEDNGNFQEMGVDSLMLVEIRNCIQALFGDRLTVNASSVRDCNTISLLSSALVKVIEGEGVEEEQIPTLEDVATLIQEDCRLSEHIRAKPDQVKVSIKDVSKILLTGCSGTLGPYLLKELSNIPQVTQVICLMRPNKSVSGQARLKKILQDRDLLSQVEMTNVCCVNGNVALPKLGMESQDWDDLCNSVDAVFHCAASVQHMVNYRKRNSDKDIRAVNVQGTKNILEFACTGSKLKQVYCASSLVAVTTVREDGRLSEDWPDLNDYNSVTKMAYPITKFVVDVLMKQAVLERGIPGKVFRFPLIVGDSKTGRFVLDQNHAMLRYMFILQQGMIPSNPVPFPMLPVDICAWASVHIFFNQNATDDVYNVSNITPGPEQEFVSVAEKLGYKVDIVDFAEFSKKLRESTPDDSPFAIFKDFYRNDEDILSLYNSAPPLKHYMLSGGCDGNFMVSKKIVSLLPEFYECATSNMDHVYRDMLFARSQGWFKKFNL